MKTEKEIRERLQKHLADERIHYAPALIQINAPLALHQLHESGIIRTLEWVLGDKPNKIMEGK